MNNNDSNYSVNSVNSSSSSSSTALRSFSLKEKLQLRIQPLVSTRHQIVPLGNHHAVAEETHG